MIRFQQLKIYIQATQAKPGGNIGAMLSPYLFSNNLSDFCKRFNEQSKDYLADVWLPVCLYCDVVEKVYTFNIKYVSFTMFLINYYNNNKKLSILFLYDLVNYYISLYKISLFNASLVLFSILKSFRRRNMIFVLSDAIQTKLKLCIREKV